MSFADELRNTTKNNKQVQLSRIECFKKDVAERYPKQVEAIKKDCLKMAERGENILIIDYDNSWQSKFLPASLSSVSTSDAYTAKKFSEYYIKKLLEKEGFISIEVKSVVKECGLSFWDDRNDFYTSCIIIRW